MTALTAVRPRWHGFLPEQLSTRPHVPFATFPLQPPSASPPRFSNEVLVRGGLPLSRQASPFASRLADAVGRIEFTFVWDHGSAFGCSPPRLATTQLPLAALPLLVPGGTGLSPFEFMHVCSHWRDHPWSRVRRASQPAEAPSRHSGNDTHSPRSERNIQIPMAAGGDPARAPGVEIRARSSGKGGVRPMMDRHYGTLRHDRFHFQEIGPEVLCASFDPNPLFPAFKRSGRLE